MIFPYVRHHVERSSSIPLGEIARPEIPVRIIGPSGFVDASGLNDTGADHVFLTVLLAEVLGVEIDADEIEGPKGAGGHELTVWPGEVELEIIGDDQSYRWLVKVGFIESGDDLAPAYLGHAGFLEYFRATFDGDAQTVDLVTNNRLSDNG